MKHELSRRSFLRVAGLGAAATIVAACQPKVVEKIVKETVEVVKEVQVEKVVKETIIVAGTPKVIEKTVKEMVTTTPAPTEPVLIECMTRGGDFIATVFDEQIAAFSKHRPDIEVRPDMCVGDWIQEVLLRVAAGTVPDCWFDGATTTGSLWRKGVVLNLEPFLERDLTFKEEDFAEPAFIAQIYANQRWGLPWDSGCMLVSFNMELFDEAGVPYPAPDKPMTWDDLIETGTALTLDNNNKHPGESGFDPTSIKQYGYIPHSTGVYLCIYSAGGEVIAADYSVPIDSPEAIEGIQFHGDIGTKYFISPSSAYPQAEMLDIRSKNAAMQYNGVWHIGRMNDAGLKYGTTPFPVKDLEASYGHYSPLVISVTSKHQQETFDWIYFACCSNEGEAILVDRGMQQPIRKDLRERFINNPNPPEAKYRQAYFDAFDPKTFRFPGDRIGSFFNAYAAEWSDAIWPSLDPVWAGTVKYEEIASELRKKMESVLLTGEQT